MEKAKRVGESFTQDQLVRPLTGKISQQKIKRPTLAFVLTDCEMKETGLSGNLASLLGPN